MRLARLVEDFRLDVLFELGLEVVIVLQLQLVVITLVVLHGLGGTLPTSFVFDWLYGLAIGWLLIEDRLAVVDAWAIEGGFHQSSGRDVGVGFLIVEGLELWLVHVLERGVKLTI